MENVEKACRALERNDINVLRFKRGEDARITALRKLPKDAVIALGGSMTVVQIGLLEALRNGDYNLIDPYEPGVSREESLARRRRGITADYFIAGTNAITENGEMVNAEGAPSVG